MTITFKEQLKTFSIAIGIGVTLIGAVVFNSRLDQLNHRIDVRDAYFTKGLIDGARAREEAFVKRDTQVQKLLAHCKSAKCDLPSELAVVETVPDFVPIDVLLMKQE